MIKALLVSVPTPPGWSAIKHLTTQSPWKKANMVKFSSRVSDADKKGYFAYCKDKQSVNAVFNLICVLSLLYSINIMGILLAQLQKYENKSRILLSGNL